MHYKKQCRYESFAVQKKFNNFILRILGIYAKFITSINVNIIMTTKTQRIHRSAITGRFVKKSTIKKQPQTTVTEKRKKCKCK